MLATLSLLAGNWSSTTALALPLIKHFNEVSNQLSTKAYICSHDSLWRRSLSLCTQAQPISGAHAQHSTAQHSTAQHSTAQQPGHTAAAIANTSQSLWATALHLPTVLACKLHDQMGMACSRLARTNRILVPNTYHTIFPVQASQAG